LRSIPKSSQAMIVAPNFFKTITNSKCKIHHGIANFFGYMET
jgi:hypothetical protein